MRHGILSALKDINTKPCYNHPNDYDTSVLSKALEELTVGDTHSLSQKLPTYTTSISTISDRLHSITTYQNLLDSFYFNSLTRRENKVSKAHAQTFEWAFRSVAPDGRTSIGLAHWLANCGGIFWIRGKAGSGKSTLMKFLSHHPTTFEYLRRWAGPKTLVLASFYFWNSGTDLQKSQEGLLRSLIFEILRQCPELATSTLASLSNLRKKSESGASRSAISSFISADQPNLIPQDGWTVDELTGIISGLVGHGTSKRFCFIIDGLDEYKACHTLDYQDLVSFLEKMAASPNIKLCLSSRPFTVFVDAFDGVEGRCLKLEELTRDDIRAFVLDSFSAHDQYRKLSRMDPKYCLLVDDVINRSQGVFLWVFLVVRELLDGLTYNDTIKTMHRRLESFPDTLEGFFQRMLDSVPKFYLPQTLHIFQIASSIDHPLPMLLYSFLADVEEDDGFAYEETHHPCDHYEALARQDIMERRLDAWCKGLLEIVGNDENGSDYLSPKVDFLHRTVRDFLQSGSVEILSNRTIGDRLQTWFLICKAMTLLFKRASTDAFQPITRGFGTIFENSSHDTCRTLDELACFSKKAQDDHADLDILDDIIYACLDAAGQVGSLSGTDIHEVFIGLACYYGMLEYIQRRLSLDQPDPDISPIRLVNIMSRVMTSSIASVEFQADVVRHIIAYADTIGISSKNMFHSAFQELIRNIGMGPRDLSPKNKSVIDLVRFIASKGFVLNKKFVDAYFPQYYTELTQPAAELRGAKRALDDDDTARHEAKRAHH